MTGLAKTCVALCCLAMIGLMATAADAKKRIVSSDVDVEAQVIVLDPEQVGSMVGELQFRGGLVLQSTAANFGGLSGLVVHENGQTFLAMSDRGTWFTGQLQYDDGMLSGIGDVMQSPMRDWRGRALEQGENDSEGLTYTDGAIIVSFERFHRLWRYSLFDPAKPKAVFERDAMAIDEFEGLQEQPNNGGIEALAALPDGRLLAISEEARTDAGDAQAWLIGEQGAERLSLTVSDGFKPTDAAALPNGDVIVLERQFSPLAGTAARLRHIRRASIRAGNIMDGTTLAVIKSPMPVDNMEGLAIVPEDGGYRFLIVSDDNFNMLQQTMLLSFFWAPGADAQ